MLLLFDQIFGKMNKCRSQYLRRIQGIPSLYVQALILTSLSISGCRTFYEPEIEKEDLGVLVVEGYLDSDGKKSELKLSRTTPLASSGEFFPEKGAFIQLRSDLGESFPLLEEREGVYVFEYTLESEQEYLLEIELANGELFQSELLTPISTPEILGVGFLKDEEGVEINVSTQGNEQVNDFLWTFQEDWIFRSYTQAGYIYDQETKSVRLRTAQEDIYTCYKTEPNPGILLENSSRFQEQVIFQKTITEIPLGDERLQARYSILINQMGLPTEAVKFWEILKKNTEDIGSIFSPLPSLISGNIQAVNGDHPVIGQVLLGRVQQKRIYINLQDVSPWNHSNPEFFGCVVEDTPLMIGTFDFHLAFGSGDYLPARAFPPEGLGPSGYYPVLSRCADCRLYASKIKPEFWEDE